jgi:hypothetical protein
MAKTYITSEQLMDTLKITSQELIKIEKSFDADPDDEWDLQEGKDYRIVVKKTGLREYTQVGAYSIANYLDKHRKPSFWDQLREWFFHKKKDIRQAFVRGEILENCSSLVKRNNRFFISFADTVAIFGTRSDYLRKMLEIARRYENPLILGQDYDNFDGEIYYSLSGIEKLSKAFQENLTQKNRRDLCEAVGEVIQDQIENKIVAKILGRAKDIDKAKKEAKERDKKCLVSHQRGDKIDTVELTAHHLYSQAEYPDLASNEDNLITLAKNVHEQFHVNFMGGFQKICTINDFIRFVQEYYPQNTSIIVSLTQKKLALRNPEPVDLRKAHVLSLPAKQVS